MIKDRRSGSERRETERLGVNIEIEWEGLTGRKTGTLGDISVRGCFVLCSGDVEDGEIVKIFLPLADKMQVQFWSEVANHIYEIGFAVRFIELTDAQKDFLKKFVAALGKVK